MIAFNYQQCPLFSTSIGTPLQVLVLPNSFFVLTEISDYVRQWVALQNMHNYFCVFTVLPATFFPFFPDSLFLLWPTHLYYVLQTHITTSKFHFHTKPYHTNFQKQSQTHREWTPLFLQLFSQASGIKGNYTNSTNFL